MADDKKQIAGGLVMLVALMGGFFAGYFLFK